MATAYSFVVLALFLALTLTIAAPLSNFENRAACTISNKRQAWHTLTNDEKLSYLNAELCLMKTPAKLGLRSARTRYDELQYVHVVQVWSAHFVGAFLPFHRMMINTHELLLRNECNYTGSQPYWQEQLDAGKFSKSSLLDAKYGFGGNGLPTTHCITDGPFKDYVNPMGPGYVFKDHCIDRQINDAISQSSSKANVDACLTKTTWETAWPCIEANPHTGGHAGVGQQMSNGVSSPGDPLFWLHHTWLDKMWADWQAKDKKRLAEMGGTNIFPQNAMFPPRPSEIPVATGAPGDPARITTLGHVLDMKGIVANATIADVMDIRGGYLCYEYIEP